MDQAQCRVRAGGCPNIGAWQAAAHLGRPLAVPAPCTYLAQTRKHGLIVTNLSSVLSSRRNLDHCIIVVYVVSVGVGGMMEDDIWTTGHV